MITLFVLLWHLWPIKRRGVGVLGLLLFKLSLGQAATLQATLDNNVIMRDQSVVLSLEAFGEFNGQNPDLTLLQRDFEVHGLTTGTRLRLVSGRTQAKTLWSVHLTPRRSGIITLPTLTIGDYHSVPLKLVVKVEQPPAAQAFFETTLTPQHPYVQAELRYTVRLLHSGRLLHSTLLEPSIDGASLQVLGEDRSKQIERGNVQLGVLERHYAIFPERSGQLIIPAPQGSCRIAQGNTPQVHYLYFPLRGKATTMTVKPRPDKLTQPWLPATAVNLQWSGSQSAPLYLGEPIVQTATIIAHSIRGVQLPELTLTAVDWARSYRPSPAHTTTEYNAVQDQLIGRREQRITLIPTTAGTYTLPTAQLSWWDTVNDQAQIAVMPTRTVTILPALKSSQTDSPGALSTHAQPLPTPLPLPPIPMLQAFGWRSAALAALLVWLVTLAAWWRERQACNSMEYYQ